MGATSEQRRTHPNGLRPNPFGQPPEESTPASFVEEPFSYPRHRNQLPPYCHSARIDAFSRIRGNESNYATLMLLVTLCFETTASTVEG